MATTPQIRVKVRERVTIQPEVENAAMGQKPPFFKAAARRPEDRDYVPRYDLG